MKRFKSFIVIGATISWLSFCLPSPAITQVLGLSQIVELYGSSTNGIVNSWSIILPNGNLQAYTMPSGKALVITGYSCFFLPNVQDSKELMVVFGKQPYNYVNYGIAYGRFQNVGAWGGALFAASDINNLKVQVLYESTKALAPGAMEVRIFGYHTPLTSSINSPINLILLGKNNGGINPLIAQNMTPRNLIR
jgi:hypothetical protein